MITRTPASCQWNLLWTIPLLIVVSLSHIDIEQYPFDIDVETLQLAKDCHGESESSDQRINDVLQSDECLTHSIERTVFSSTSCFISAIKYINSQSQHWEDISTPPPRYNLYVRDVNTLERYFT